jgi:hypothetical protein
MASWIKCTTKDGIEGRLSLDHVAMIRPHHLDRGFTGNEIIFSAGTLSSILVVEDQGYLVGPPSNKGATRCRARRSAGMISFTARGPADSCADTGREGTAQPERLYFPAS